MREFTVYYRVNYCGKGSKPNPLLRNREAGNHFKESGNLLCCGCNPPHITFELLRADSEAHNVLEIKPIKSSERLTI